MAKQKLTLDMGSSAPLWWKRLSRAIRFILASLIVSFSSTDLYDDHTSKKIVFFMGLGIILMSGLDIAFGSKELVEEDTLQKPGGGAN